jgi:hypothetical protein
MKLEDLENRLKIIEADMHQLVADYNVMQGMKNEVMYWIEKVKQSESDNN